MRTAQVVGTLGGGGAQRLVHNLALGLMQRGVESDCIALKRAGEEVPRGEGWPAIHEIGAGVGGGMAQVTKLAAFRRVVAAGRYDVVHVHGSQGLPFVIAAMMGMSRRPRVVFTWHDSEGVLSGRGMRERALRWSVRRCDKVTGSSRSVAERLQAVSGGDAEVFRNGVPEANTARGSRGQVENADKHGEHGEPRREEPERDCADPMVLWIARLVPPKAPKILVRAAAALRKEGLRFRVVMAGGAGARFEWLAEETRALARELGVAEMIEMPGWVDDPGALLARGAIGVQTSMTEGLSLSLLEMMMAGLAIVATDVGDTAVAVRDGETGLLIPPGDEAALAASLLRLIEDGVLRARLGARAREVAFAEFSVGAMAERAEAMYMNVLSGAKAAA